MTSKWRTIIWTMINCLCASLLNWSFFLIRHWKQECVVVCVPLTTWRWCPWHWSVASKHLSSRSFANGDCWSFAVTQTMEFFTSKAISSPPVKQLGLSCEVQPLFQQQWPVGLLCEEERVNFDFTNCFLDLILDWFCIWFLLLSLLVRSILLSPYVSHSYLNID